jgi:hypothetical protein
VTTSGTYNFGLQGGDIVLNAYSRIQIRGSDITTEHWHRAYEEVNLELQTWANLGVNLWKVLQSSFTVVAGTTNYTLPANCAQILDVWYSISAAPNPGTIDRYLTPISRTQYDMTSYKAAPGTPTSYWQERTTPPVLVLYQPDTISGNTLNYHYLSQIQDFNLIYGENPDVPNRFLDALIAQLSARLVQHFPERFRASGGNEDRLIARAEKTWLDARDADSEKVPMGIYPDLSAYRPH